MVKVGDVVMKVAGRDAGRIGVVVEAMQNGYYMLDGDTRKKKVNFRHIEFLGKELKIGKNTSSEDLRKAISELGFKVNKHGQPRKKAEQKEAVKAPAKEDKPKKSVKKAEKK